MTEGKRKSNNALDRHFYPGICMITAILVRNLGVKITCTCYLPYRGTI